MKTLLKQLVGESAVYGISGIITKFIGIFLVPLYTNVFTPADYGSINIINSFFFFVSILVVFALDNSAARWYYDNEDMVERKKTISSWFWFQLMFSFLICILIIIFSSFLSDKFLHSTDSKLFVFSSLSVFTGTLPLIVQNVLRMQRKSIQTVVFSLLYTLLTIGFTIYFVLYKHVGVVGVFYASTLSNVIASIYCIILLYHWIKPSMFSLERLKEMIRFALPMLPTSVAFWVINSSSTFVLEYFFNLKEVGLFQLGITISSAVTLFTSAFQMAWGPFAYSIINKENAKQVYSTVLTAFTLIANLIALSIALYASELLILFTSKEYYEAYIVAGILSFNSTIYSYVYIVGIGNGIVKNNKPLAIAVLISAGVTAITLFILTPVFGKVGTAISMVIGNMVIPVYVYFSAQKAYYIPYKSKVTVLISLISFAYYLLYFTIETNTPYINVLIKSCFILFFIISCLLILFSFDRDSFHSIKRMLEKIKKTPSN